MAMVYKAAAGTATAELTILVKGGTFLPNPLHGCFVKRDANLNAFIDKRYITNHNEYESCKYLFYSYPVEEFQRVLANAVITYRKISKDKKSDKQIEIPLKNEPLVITFDGHFFLCCDFEDIKKHRFSPKKNPNASKFLQDYSTEFNKIQNLGSEIYGLGFENKCLQFISLDLTRCQSEGSDIYRIWNDETRCTFDKLNDAGPLLLKKDDKTKFLVGCYKKCTDGTTGNCRIKVDIFGKSQSQTSASHAIDGGSSGDGTETGQAAGTQTPTDGAGTGQAGDTQTPTDGAGTGQQDGRFSEYETGQPTESSLPAVLGAGNGQAGGIYRPPAAGAGNRQAGGNRPPAAGAGNGQAGGNRPPAAGAGNGQQTLADLFRRKTRVLDGLCLCLDLEYRVIQNWRHLADRLDAPDSVKDRCKCGTRHSPTELLLEVPEVSSVTVAQFLQVLEEMKRKDVVLKITEKISAADWNKKISEAILNDYELSDEIAQKLDKDSKLKNNWRGLGQKLKVSRDDLKQIERGNNPANKLFLHAYQTLEPDKLKAGYFRRLVENHLPRRKDIKDFLETLAVTLQDERSIKDVFSPESDNLRKLCAYLNLDAGGTLKNWKHLASAWKIEYDTYKSFDDQEKIQPTEVLLQWLIQEHVNYTVGQLCASLEGMERNDVREYLEEEARR